ncbi:MAG: hypothetical protein KIT83_20930 [Bryobacterales bacterium]|nr:hypothetical protein [Bryobacterales bacterium]
MSAFSLHSRHVMPHLFGLLVLLIAGAGLRAADSWELQYQHLDKEYDLRLVDVAFVDAKRGLAVGYIDSRTRDRQRPVNLVTTDGTTWRLFEVKKRCDDVFALGSGILFAACEDGIYRSDELGSDWKRVARLKDIESVWFLNERRGFAVGASKGFYETQDGGQRWAPVATKPEISTNPDVTTLRHIHFVGERHGFVTGWSRPPTNRDRIPDWLMPDRAMQQRDTPHVNVFADTSDAGATWRAQEVSMFGEVVTTELGPDHVGMTLVNFSNGFEYPAEVFYFRWPNGEMVRTFREKRRAVTDVAVPERGPVYLAAVEPVGQLYWSPIPGRLRVLRSADFMTWEEMDVDYRASARRASIEAYDPDNVWLVTDTGMILKLKRDGGSLPERSKPTAPPK